MSIGAGKRYIRSSTQSAAQNKQRLEGMQKDWEEKDQELGKISDWSQNFVDTCK